MEQTESTATAAATTRPSLSRESTTVEVSTVDKRAAEDDVHAQRNYSRLIDLWMSKFAAKGGSPLQLLQKLEQYVVLDMACLRHAESTLLWNLIGEIFSQLLCTVLTNSFISMNAMFECNSFAKYYVCE
eukprot:m.109063 g.109063  ORF g.109063 m.109063 type:complete len:129 (-) comp12724_c11_seq2:969-1355(-)